MKHFLNCCALGFVMLILAACQSTQMIELQKAPSFDVPSNLSLQKRIHFFSFQGSLIASPPESSPFKLNIRRFEVFEDLNNPEASETVRIELARFGKQVLLLEGSLDDPRTYQEALDDIQSPQAHQIVSYIHGLRGHLLDVLLGVPIENKKGTFTAKFEDGYYHEGSLMFYTYPPTGIHLRYRNWEAQQSIGNQIFLPTRIAITPTDENGQALFGLNFSLENMHIELVDDGVRMPFFGALAL